MNGQDSNRKKLDYSELIPLMSAYRDEWQYRDNLFLTNFFRYSSLSLIITFFPDLLGKIGISYTATLVVKVPSIYFSIFGILCALFGVYYSFNEAKKIVKIDEAYKELMLQLPDECRIEQLDKTKSKLKKCYYSIRLNTVLCFSYIIPIGLAVLNIYYMYH